MHTFEGHPPELRRLFFIELWERFSYFGLAALLVLFMTSSLEEGGLGWSTDKALLVKAAYGSGIYLLAIPCSLLADRWLGSASSVFLGAVFIVIGHATLAVPLGFTFIAGLAFVAVGTSFLKPSLNGLVGDLYRADLAPMKKAGMALFYMSISIGGLFGPLVLGYLRLAPFATPTAGWHIAFGAAAFGMAIALCLFIGFWRGHRRAKPPAPTSGWLIAWVFIGSSILLWLLVWGTDRPGLMWALYALIPISALLLALRATTRKQAVWMVMLAISTSVSVVVGQMVSGLTLVIKGHVEPAVFGWTFPIELFPGMFSGFIILFTLLISGITKKKPDILNYGNVFTIGVVCIAVALGIIGISLSAAGGAKVSAWAIIASYVFKAAAEALIIPLALSLMHDVSTEDDKSLTMAIWFLGAGLGVNMAKMLGLSMGQSAPELGAFFNHEAMAAAFLALVLWFISPWLARTASEIKLAHENSGSNS